MLSTIDLTSRRPVPTHGWSGGVAAAPQVIVKFLFNFDIFYIEC
jgi:hypothetical protein